MKPKVARRILLLTGFICGFGLMAGFVAMLLVVLAQSSGAGWRSRHVRAAGRLWRQR